MLSWSLSLIISDPHNWGVLVVCTKYLLCNSLNPIFLKLKVFIVCLRSLNFSSINFHWFLNFILLCFLKFPEFNWLPNFTYSFLTSNLSFHHITNPSAPSFTCSVTSKWFQHQLLQLYSHIQTPLSNWGKLIHFHLLYIHR